MNKWIFMVFLIGALAGCQRYGGAPGGGNEAKETGQAGWEETKEEEAEGETDEEGETEGEEYGLDGPAETGAVDGGREDEEKEVPAPVKVKGIYVSAFIAGSENEMGKILGRIDETELNAVVIDVKDDEGRVTFDMDSAMVQKMGACVKYIPDMGKLTEELKAHGVYRIARISAFRDPYLAQAKPEWCCKLADGSIFRDRNGFAWINPYKREAWDYLIEIALKAGEAGFEEIQFDYLRFCTEKGMDQVVFEQLDTGGKSREEIILEFAGYAGSRLREAGLFVSADVFGTVIGGGIDAAAVGQDYKKLAGCLDYICPMIYPSHYGDGNFGIAHPDTMPYDTILGALASSRKALEDDPQENGQKREGREGRQAVVRPWLQDFTASYLRHYIPYGAKEVRDQIQAVYDAGYDEWILWNASVNYHYDGLQKREEGDG